MGEDGVLQIFQLVPRLLSMFRIPGSARCWLPMEEKSKDSAVRSYSRGFSERRHIAPSHIPLPSTTVSVCTATTRCCLMAISLVINHCRTPMPLLIRGFQSLPIACSLPPDLLPESVGKRQGLISRT